MSTWTEQAAKKAVDRQFAYPDAGRMVGNVVAQMIVCGLVVTAMTYTPWWLTVLIVYAPGWLTLVFGGRAITRAADQKRYRLDAIPAHLRHFLQTGQWRDAP
jgi:hypothetical protein